MQLAIYNNRAPQRGHVACYDALQSGDDLCADSDGVNAVVGLGCVAGFAFHGDKESVRSCGVGTHAGSNGANGLLGIDVLAENSIHMGIFQCAVGDHLLSAAVCRVLLRRLEQQLHATVKGVAKINQHLCDAQQHGGVGIVAAGMHDAGILRGKGQVGTLLNG